LATLVPVGLAPAKGNEFLKITKVMFYAQKSWNYIEK
jgi:hypothetical protein